MIVEYCEENNMVYISKNIGVDGNDHWIQVGLTKGEIEQIISKLSPHPLHSCPNCHLYQTALKIISSGMNG